MDGDHVQPIEQVFPERTVFDRLGQLAVAGRNNPHIDADRFAGAERGDLALLDGAQKLDLQGERDLGDLIQEQGATVGGLEHPVVIGNRAGKGAPAVTEELAVEQGL